MNPEPMGSWGKFATPDVQSWELTQVLMNERRFSWGLGGVGKSKPIHYIPFNAELGSL